MKFKLEIDCDGAAFEDDPRPEITLILDRLTDHIGYSFDFSIAVIKNVIPLRDSNGNTVGRAWIEN